MSNLLTQTIENDNSKIQLASPDDHRQLPAERSIQDVKSHFISIRCIADKTFSTDNWDSLLQHTEDTLNMLRPSKLNPLLSACATLRGHFNYMATPLAPAGCKVLVHDRPKNRGSWADKGTEGFFITQAPDHYRNFTCYMPITNSIRISNTVEFFPQNCTLPALEPLDTVAHILSELRDILTNYPRNNLFTGRHHDLLHSLNTIQALLGLPSYTKQ